MEHELKMNEQLQEDWLDAKLRDEAPYIDDAGFTARVVQQLPARRQSSSMRAFILLGVTLLACVITYLISGRGIFLANAAEFMVAMPFRIVCVIAVISALTVMGLGTSAAVLKTREGRALNLL